jgi:hypothetical protein
MTVTQVPHFRARLGQRAFERRLFSPSHRQFVDHKTKIVPIGP